MWFSRHFFAPFLFDRSRNNRRDKLRSKFWSEKMFRKLHLKLLRWFSVHGTNKPFSSMRGLLPSSRKILEHETRPNSLINVDVRIACNKIKNFTHDLVHSDQIAYANDDYIGESIRFVDNILEYTECNETMHIYSNSIILWHSIGRRPGLVVLRFDW